MSAGDFRVINVNKTAEEAALSLFDLFGYRLLSSQEVNFNPAEPVLLGTIYSSSRIDESLAGVVFLPKDWRYEHVNYVKLVFARSRQDELYEYYHSCERSFSRLVFDRYLLEKKIDVLKKKQWMPVSFLLLYIALAIAGIFLFAFGSYEGGQSGGALFFDAPITLCFFGLISFFGGVFLGVLHFFLRFLLSRKKQVRLLKEDLAISQMVINFKKALERLDSTPSFDINSLVQIEKKERLFR